MNVRIGPGALRFVRHFVEMLVAMLLGMGAATGLTALILAVAGSSYASAERDAPALFVVLMAVSMTAPMAAWMRHRGHRPARIAEMVGAMLAVTVACLALLAVGALAGKAAVDAQHTAMVPAMLAVMLVRRSAYSRPAGARSEGLSNLPARTEPDQVS